jgi:hypothetical protein
MRWSRDSRRIDPMSDTRPILRAESPYTPVRSASLLEQGIRTAAAHFHHRALGRHGLDVVRGATAPKPTRELFSERPASKIADKPAAPATLRWDSMRTAGPVTRLLVAFFKSALIPVAVLLLPAVFDSRAAIPADHVQSIRGCSEWRRLRATPTVS